MKYKCTVSYSGHAYAGWQIQDNGLSIQQIIEEILSRIANEPVHITGSGRTDAGVNARGQVFMFDTKLEMSAYRWMGALNGYLPADIHIMDCQEVPGSFHARYQVRRKTYTYRINNGPYDVFTKDTAYQFQIPLDYERMQECAKLFEGVHDFASFNASPLSLYPDQTRKIDSVVLNKEDQMISITFTGKGFLRYQVRMMSAAIIEAGKHKVTVEEVRTILQRAQKNISKKNAPPNGLTLEKVEYFEQIALSDKIQIRGFLSTDIIPEGLSYEELVERENRHASDRIYYICTRHEQEHLGYLYVHDTDVKIVLYRSDAGESVHDVYCQIESWMKENMLENLIMETCV